MQTNLSALAPMAEQPIHSANGAANPTARPVFQPMLYLRRHPWVASSVFAAMMLVGGWVLREYLKPTYNVQSVVYVSPIFPHELAEDHEHDRTYDDFIEQQIHVATRYSTLKQAVDKYRAEWVRPGQDEQDVIAALQKTLKVEQMGHSYQISLSLKSRRREHLADFLNEVTAGYLTAARNDEFFGRDDRITTLSAERQRIATQLEAALGKQQQQLVDLGIARFDPKTADNPYDAQMTELRKQLADAHEKRAEADAQVFALNSKASAAGGNTLSSLASAQANNDPGLLTMLTQLNTRRATLVLQMNGLTPQNPLYTQSQAEIGSIDSELEHLRSTTMTKVAGEMQGKASNEHERAVRLESQLTSDLNKTQTRAAAAAPKLLQADQYSDEIGRLQASYALVDSRIESLTLEGSSPGSEHIVSWALPPANAVGKMAAAAVFGLLLMSLLGGLVAAFIADLIDPNVYTAGDIHRLLGFPPIGMLLDEEDYPANMSSEYLLRLAGGIDQAHRRTGARTFVFTSAGLGDTRSLVKDLGEELTVNGLNTLVILVENPKPGAPAGAQAVEASRIDAPGTSGQATTELVAGQKGELGVVAGRTCEVVTVPPRGAAEYMRRARTSHNTVLVAADPLLTSAHTEYLARAADGTVLVAESGAVSKKQLSRVAKLLERLKISGIAIILSQIPKHRADQEINDNATEYAQIVAQPS